MTGLPSRSESPNLGQRLLGQVEVVTAVRLTVAGGTKDRKQVKSTIGRCEP